VRAAPGADHHGPHIRGTAWRLSYLRSIPAAVHQPDLVYVAPAEHPAASLQRHTAAGAGGC
jgi:hypothetical protein